MTTMTDSPVGTPPESFRLSMLLNDTRYRSLTFQFIALVAIIAFMAFVGGNLVRNLAEAGLNISYAFLGEPAGYDINQRPIEYDSQSSHGRAAIVGLLNTLIVAFLACITATVFGVVAGVLRLSNNWIVRKLMSFYVEIFRNVPVLIWILIIFSIMINAMPGPRAFRGENATSSMLFDSFAFTNRGVFAPSPVFNTAFWVVAATFLLSLVAIYLFRANATKKLYSEGKLIPTFWPTLALLFLPTMAVMLIPANPLMGILFIAVCVLFVVGVYLAFTKIRELVPGDNLGGLVALIAAAGMGYIITSLIAPIIMAIGPALGAGPAVESIMTWNMPELKGFNFKGGLQIRGSLIALWFALAIYTGAFIAENVRAGILAISKGQTEAAGALGLRPNRIMNLVILPQALRVIIPPLISQYLNITKNSSLAIAVGYMDVTGTLGGITLLQTGRAIETILLLMLFYLTISLLISFFMNIFNNRMKLQER